MKLLAALLFASATLLHAEVKFTVQRVSDQRDNNEFSGRLAIHVAVSGTELATGQRMRLKLENASDNTGKNLLAAGRAPIALDQSGEGFQELNATEYAFDESKRPGSLVTWLANPARQAESIKLAGHLEILAPNRDPKSTITAPLFANIGKAFQHESLRAAQITLRITSLAGRDVKFDLSDPSRKIDQLEFCRADGTPLKTASWSHLGSENGNNHRVVLDAPAPRDIALKIQLVSPGALVRIPFQLDKIKLP